MGAGPTASVGFIDATGQFVLVSAANPLPTSGAAVAVAWVDIADKPAVIAAGTDAAAARTAIGAAATAHVHAGADLTSGTVPIARIPTGTTSVTVATGDKGLLSTAPVVNNAATFADLTAATTAYNALLAALRTRGVIGGA